MEKEIKCSECGRILTKKYFDRKKRQEKIMKLRQQGLSYQSISKLHNLSRARIHQLISGYDPSEIEYRDKVLKRDNYQCQWKKQCKGKKVPIKKLVVHHIDFDNKNNNLKNLITLCNKCHLGFHGKEQVNRKSLTKVK